MNLKISLLFVVLAGSLCVEAQTARNPLNHEPARVSLQKGISSWKLSEEIFYRADDKPFNKYSHTYDENGRKTAELSFRLIDNDQTWLSSSKIEYGYDNEKLIVMNWSGLQYTTKTEIFSDSEGKSRYSFTYSWNSDADDWSVNPYTRSEYVYNDEGNVTACLKQHKNKTTNEWNDFDVRILYSYNETGALTEELYQTWSEEPGQWLQKGKYSYSNSSELKREAISYYFHTDNWIFDGKTVYFYDKEGKIIRCEYYKNSTDKAPNAYSINTYAEGAGLPETFGSNEISVSPNPVVSSFTLTVTDQYVGKMMYMFDAWGKQVKSVPIAHETTQIDVSGLPRGIYMLKTGELSQKIILK